MKRSIFLFCLSILFVWNNALAQGTVSKIATQAFYESDELLTKTQEYDERFFNKVYPFDPEGYLKRGIEKMMSSFPEEAMKDFDEALGLYPDCSYCYFLKGICSLSLDSTAANAKAAFKQAIYLDPLLAEASNELANIYLQEEKIDSAEQILNKSVEYSPTFGLTYFHLGVIALYDDRMGKAKRLFKKAVELEKCLIRAHMGIVMVYVNNYQLGQASKQLEEAISCESSSGEFYFARGFLQLIRERYKDALEDLSKAIALEPENATYLLFHALANIALKEYHVATESIIASNQVYRQGSRKEEVLSSGANFQYYSGPIHYYSYSRYSLSDRVKQLIEEGLSNLMFDEEALALKKFEKALTKSKNNCMPCYYFMGKIQKQSFKQQAALKHYDAFLEQESSLTEAIQDRASLYMDLNQPEQAITDYTSLLELDTNITRLHLDRGNAYVQTGEFQKAILDFDQCLTKDSLQFDARYNRGICYQQIQFYDNAIGDFNFLYKHNDKDLTALYQIAVCQFMKGNKIEARNACKKVLESNPTYPEAYNIIGAIMMDEEKYLDAVFNFNQAIEHRPNYLDAYFNRYLCSIKLGQIENALRDLNTVIELRPNTPSYYLYRAQLKNQMGNETACEDLQSALRLGVQLTQEEINTICP